jgi:hypothetical protein
VERSPPSSPIRARPTAIALLAALALTASLEAGCSRDRRDPPNPVPDGDAFDTTIHASPKLVSIPVRGPDGGVERVTCASCHTIKPVKALPRAASELKDFHQGLTFRHGELGCSHCHVEGARSHDSLHFANGEVFPMVDAIRLCQQCHGPQYRDYSHGSHGGMQGAWSPALGPRTRNHCVDCHDPHSPRFQGGAPVFPPADRGTVTSLGGSHG